MEYRIKLNEKNHTYEIEIVGGKTKKADYSCTQVLKCVGVSPDYANADEKVVKAKASRGTTLHKQCQDYFEKNLSILDMDKEAITSVAVVSKMLNKVSCETPLFIEYKGKIIAGSIDVLGFRGEKENIGVLIDYKFTSSYYENSVEAQLNLYNYMLKKNNGNVVNGKNVVWDKNKVELHPIHNGDLMSVAVWSDKEVEDMLDCLIEGKEYLRPYDLPSEVNVELVEKAESYIQQMQEKIKQAEEKIKDIRSIILTSMQNQRVSKIVVGNVEYSIKSGYTRNSIDTKKLKEEDMKTYEKYLKPSQIPPTLLVKTLNKENKKKEEAITVKEEREVK